MHKFKANIADSRQYRQDRKLYVYLNCHTYNGINQHLHISIANLNANLKYQQERQQSM